jgi:hypothetical protein
MTRLPRRWLAIAIALAMVPVTLLEALALAILPYSGSRIDQLFRVWLWFLICALPIGLLIGFPVAARWLRDPERGWIAWGFAGGVAGALGGIAAMLVLALATQLFTLLGHFLVAGVVVMALTTGGGVLTALLARWIALALTRRFG